MFISLPVVTVLVLFNSYSTFTSLHSLHSYRKYSRSLIFHDAMRTQTCIHISVNFIWGIVFFSQVSTLSVFQMKKVSLSQIWTRYRFSPHSFFNQGCPGLAHWANILILLQNKSVFNAYASESCVLPSSSSASSCDPYLYLLLPP